MAIQVDGRKVYLRQGRLTQTVNICYDDNRRGRYEATYVLTGPEHFVRDDEVAASETIAALKEWLVRQGASLRAAGDPPDAPVDPADAVAAAAIGTRCVGMAAADDNWISEARTIVDAAIDELLIEFTRCPYLHRVEHSIHARLFSLLCDRPLFSQHVALAGGGGQLTMQVLHKEWPEQVARGTGRRGNFDLAILSPDGIALASVGQFLEGRIVPCIAIEMGLGYDDGHLLSDHAKLLNSRIPHPYLVHLARDPADLAREEDAVRQIQAAGAARVGYAAAAGGERRLKRVADDQIVTCSL